MLKSEGFAFWFQVLFRYQCLFLRERSNFLKIRIGGNFFRYQFTFKIKANFFEISVILFNISVVFSDMGGGLRPKSRFFRS